MFSKELLPYAIDVVGLDQPGIVHRLSRVLRLAQRRDRRSLDPQLSGRTYGRADVLGADATSTSLLGVHIAALREEFMEFCDQLNVDAIMEPVKHN